MKPALFFDVETTGTDPARDAIVQIAAVLDDGQGRERAALNLLIRPDGWTVPGEAARLHGITTEIAAANGVPLVVALAAFNHLCRAALVGVGHNVGFDIRFVKAAFVRIGRGEVCALGALDVFCTKEWATPIVNLPPTDRMVRAGYGHKPKAAKLEEAIRHFFGEDLDGAHDALVDVRACRRLYHLARTRGEA